MRWIGAVICCVLVAGSSNAQLARTANVGEEFTFGEVKWGHNVASCHLTTPALETLNFFYDQPSENDARYVLEPLNEMRPCSVRVQDLVLSDTGLWTLTSKHTDGAEDDITSYNLVVYSGDVDSDEEADITWLNRIEFPTRVGQNIDISLSKAAYPEDCYIRKPDGTDVEIADGNREGVTAHTASDFVSCRITIGPMDDTLLGDWALCGKRTDNIEEKDRCQLVRITWQNAVRPDTDWITTNPDRFSHVVNYGGTLTPIVRGSGSWLTCHIITPGNEDLVIDADSEYPNLKLVSTDTSTCSIAIGPIQESMLGDWTLYGKFRDSFGINEVRLPMNLFLYDQHSPYDQAYNVTIRDPVKRAVNLGSTLNLEVPSSDTVDSCEVITPSEETFSLNGPSYEGASFVSIGNAIACRIAIGPITEQILGKWTIIGKFSRIGSYIEEQHTYEILKEDPANPIIEEGTTVENMTPQRVTTDIGTLHRLTIATSLFVTRDSCHIRTPDGLQYEIMEGFNVAGVEVIEGSGVECGVNVHVLSEEAVGTWTLIARGTRSSQRTERRLAFTIDVEETVEAMPKEVTISEGNDLHVRLAATTEQHDTCKLEGPNGAVSSYVVDPLHVQSCGYIISNIKSADAGTWKIVYGSRAIYTAPIVVSVTAVAGVDTEFSSVINLARDRSANMTVGPEDAVYCHLVDPQGVTVFDDFGPCTLALDKVVSSHHGAWRMMVAQAGKVIGVEHQLLINVIEAAAKPVVTTNVAQAKPIVTVTCSVATDANVRACKFRDPQGKLLLAAGGVAEDRYVFHGSETTYESSVRTHECGLQITNPLVSDLGLWRCAIDTDEDTYYGFMPVLCPWALMDPAVAAIVQQVPILKSERTSVVGVEDEPVTMSCAVEAAIRYCYFRASNGTVFAVSPGMSSPDMEYVGAGFDAGDCGVRFHSMKHRDSGQWSCHVGLVSDHEEQRDIFALSVLEPMNITHYYNQNSDMIVEGLVYEGRALDYCRYVRIDGFGFTTDEVPTEYTNSGHLTQGICQLTIRNPTILDMHPWTIAAKIRGQDVEISRDTMQTIVIEGPPQPEENEVGSVHYKQRGLSIFFYVFMSILLVSILVGVVLGPRKSREWTYARASALRNSTMRSFRKKPLPPQAPIRQNV